MVPTLVLSLDPRFVILMTSCLQGKNASDRRPECLVGVDDGSLCALSLGSDRSFDSLPSIPSKDEFAWLRQAKSKLPKSLQFASPQPKRFATSTSIQALCEIDRLLPGTEIEIQTSASSQALSLEPDLKSVKVLTPPHMEFDAMLTEELLARHFRCILMLSSCCGGT